MAISKAKKAELVKKFGKDEKDTGAIEVQIAILTEEINVLTGDFRSEIPNFLCRFPGKYTFITKIVF